MRSWESVAAREPYFAVLTSPRFLRAQLTPEREREFFESGERLVDYLFELIAERLAPDFAPTAILEYGCGVGRLALPLARRAGARGGRVVAVERSPAMLAVAGEQATRQAVTNVAFIPPEEFADSPGSFDFICCYLVLQRMPAREGLALVRRLMSRLAPGGVAVFLVPYQTTAAPIVRALRWLRARLTPVNAAVNLVRRRRLDEPFQPTYAYDFSRVMAAIQRETAVSTNALLEPHEGLDTALLFVEAPMAGAPARRRERGIDVADVIRTTPIEALNQSADEYFAALDGWEHHLAKPFASAEEAPRLLGGLAVLLQGLELAPGVRVLEFGAGTGWLSRSLTQLGCHVTALDVSPTALDIARETYARFPAAGEQPPPRFLLFDGRRIEMDAGSVDRIVCFHAFHHVPNPDEVIREFARVLAPGGIAGFAEPGPRHSRSSFSQFEMQTYKVVENDVDVHAIWRVAKVAGFADIRLSVFHGPPFSVPLQEFEDFLAGGATADRWTASTRIFMRSARTFFLVKEGEPVLDSRTAGALRCEIVVSPGEVTSRTGEPAQIDVTLTNTGRAVWLPSNVRFGGVRIGAHLYDASGGLLQFDLTTAPLSDPPREVRPRDVVRCRLALPPQRPGRYLVEIDCVAEGIAWFAPLGSRAVRVTLDVAAG